MAFVERILSDGEELIQSQKLHWIYPVTGFFAMIALSLLGILGSTALYIYGTPDIPKSISGITLPVFSTHNYALALLFCAAGVFLFFIYLIKYLSTEISVTDKRIVIKRGLVFVDVTEIDLEEIKGEDINYGYFGYLLNYGSLRLDCRFIKDISVPVIANPAKFTRIFNRARAEQTSNMDKFS